MKENLGLAFELLIEKAHRVDRLTHSVESPRNSLRPFVCRLYDWKEKENILKQLEYVNRRVIFVNEDVAEGTTAKRREQLPLLRQAKHEVKDCLFRP